MKVEKTVGIGAAVQQCGVSEKQLRYWQKSGYITPDSVTYGDRTYRRYRDSDLALIMEIKKMLDEGFTLAKAVQKTTISLEDNHA